MAAASTVPTTLASVYVGDLHQDVSDGMLFDVFSEFKSLASVRLCRDSSTGRSLCYGYVNFEDPEDAGRAIDEKNHSTLNGKTIRVMWSRRDPDARSGIGNVFVKNLDDSIDNIKLQEMFQKFGNVLSVKVVTSDNGKSKGYGFIQFESEDSANAAIEELNGFSIGGKQMYVGKFVKKSDRVVSSQEAKYTNLYVKNIDLDISEEVLKQKFSQYGNILSLVISKDENGASRGFGFVNFEDPDDAKHAKETLHGSQLGSKVLYVSRAQKKSEREEMLCHQFEEKRKEQMLKYQASNVYVKNIDYDITEDELRQHFSQCGSITSAKLMRDDKGVSKGFGFVCFSNPEEANKAVITFHGFTIRRKPLYVAIAQRKEERKYQLQLRYAQQMSGLIGPSAIIPGGYPPFYYLMPSVVQQIPAGPCLMYPPMVIGPAIQPYLVPSGSNDPRQHQQKERMNDHLLPQAGFPTYASHFQQPANSIASANSHAGHVMYVPTGHSSKMNKESPAGQEVGTGAEGSKTYSLLAAAPPEHHKHILGEQLYLFVAQFQPDLAAKITGMLLEMDNSELLLLLDSPESLAAKIDKAVEMLKLSEPKLSTQQSIPTYMSAEPGVN